MADSLISSSAWLISSAVASNFRRSKRSRISTTSSVTASCMERDNCLSLASGYLQVLIAVIFMKFKSPFRSKSLRLGVNDCAKVP